MKILVVEDEPRLAEFIKKGLEENMHNVDIAYDGQIGKTLAMTGAFDALVLDVNLPKMNGFELTSLLRNEGLNMPIIMLTAMASIQDKTTGFEAGADDYLVKPFEFQELLLRLNALNIRSGKDHSLNSKIVFKDLELDLNLKVARRGGKEIELTAKEFTLLEYLLRNKGKVVSRVDIAEKVWDIQFDTGTNTIDVYINFLRKKIDRDFDVKIIHTVIGMGYVIKD